MVSQDGDRTRRHGAPPPGVRLRRLVGCCSLGLILLCAVWSPHGATLLGRYGPPSVQAQDRHTASGLRQRQGWLSNVLGSLQGRGVDLGSLQHQLGLPSLSPTEMGPDEYARVANYARRQHPDVMEEQVRSQPWFVKAMGNPIVMGALGMIASKMLRR